jgi:hypothetical protein
MMNMKTYYDNMEREEDTSLCFPKVMSRDLIQNLVASMSDDQALGEWELCTVEDVK